jgi:hypothetical protein
VRWDRSKRHVIGAVYMLALFGLAVGLMLRPGGADGMLLFFLALYGTLIGVVSWALLRH